MLVSPPRSAVAPSLTKADIGIELEVIYDLLFDELLVDDFDDHHDAPHWIRELQGIRQEIH